MEKLIYIYSVLFFLKSNKPVFLSKMEGERMCSLRSSAMFFLNSDITGVLGDEWT